jgi:hypothetical protein
MLHLLSRRASRTAIVSAAAAVSIAASAQALPINSWIGTPASDVWGNPNNWNNGNVPTIGEQATVFSGNVALYSQPANSVGSVQVLKLGNPAILSTNGYRLNILNTLTIDGAGASVYAGNAPAGSLSLLTPALSMTNGSVLWLQTGAAKVRVATLPAGTANGAMTVDATSTVYANGVLDTGSYVNNGTLKGDATLGTVNVANNFYLSGVAGKIAVIDSNFSGLTINAGTFNLHSSFTKIDVSKLGSVLTLNGDTDLANGNVGSDIYVGDSAQLKLTGGTWQFGFYAKQGAIFVPHGSVNLNGGTTLAEAAKVNDYAAYFTNVNVTGYANLQSGEFDGGANVNVAGASSYLYVKDAYFRGNTFSQAVSMGGTGTMKMNGNTVVGFSSPGIAYTALNVGPGGAFDWDGSSESAATCFIENGELNIAAAAIDEQTYFNGVPINHFGYDGTINVANDAKLNVSGTAWTLFGTMELYRGALVQGQTLTFDGTYLAAGANSLHLTGTGGVVPTIEAPVVLKNDAYVFIENGGGLNLKGTTNYAGCFITSAPFGSPGQPYGIITQNAAATVSDTSTIFCNTLDMDGSANTTDWTINAGATLHQGAWNLDAPNSTTNPYHSTMTLNGGTIDMDTDAGKWTLTGGTLNMNQSGFNLPFVTHDKLVLGSGAAKGIVNVGGNTTAYISGGLHLGATSAVGGNIINVGALSTLYIGPSFTSDANAMLTKNGPGQMIVNVPQNHGVGSLIEVKDGTLVLNSNAGGSGPTLSIHAWGGSVYFSTSQQLNGLHVDTLGKVTVAQPANLNARLTISADMTFSGGLLDLNANDLIAREGAPLVIRHVISQGYSGGTWAGTVGLKSSAAAASPGHALGYLLNNNGLGGKIYNSFNGYNVSLTDVLVKYTLTGDSDLDGTVGFNDLVALAQNYNGLDTTWQKGDFNYDGLTDFNDLVPLAQNYNQVLSLSEQAQLNADGGASFAAGFALAQSLVPEPTTLCVLGLALPMIARRR